MELWGIDDSCKGNNLVDYFNPTDFILAISENRNLVRKKVKVDKTGKYAEMHRSEEHTSELQSRGHLVCRLLLEKKKKKIKKIKSHYDFF